MRKENKRKKFKKEVFEKKAVRKWFRNLAVFFLSLAIVVMDLSFNLSSIDAYSISNGLTAEGNQIWQQGSHGLSGSPEGHVIIPTGVAGSYRNRGDEFGAGLAAGDFNGDGIDDLAIAAPDEDASISNVDEGTPYGELRRGNGAVTIIYGGVTSNGLSASTNSDQFWDKDNVGRPEITTGGQFGFALEAGDYNGDGIDDLAIGIPYQGKGGAVVILYGSYIIGLTSVYSQYIDQDTPGMHGASETGDRFGWALSSGRFNNDGYADLAIGVPGEDDDAGAVAVIYGSSIGLDPFAGPVNQLLEQGKDGMKDKAESEVIKQQNEDKGDNFGHSLAAGNFTPSPTDDLAIGVPGEIIGDLFSGPGKAGAVHIVYSDNSGLNPNGFRGDFLWHQDIYSTFNGERRDVEGIAEGGDLFGYALAAGNFGHNFLDDLAIGIPGEDKNAGAVAILFGSVNGIHLFPYNDQLFDQNSPGIHGGAEGNTPRGGDNFGMELEAGNFNASKYDDLAIGVPGEDDYAGAVAVIYGDSLGLSATAGPGNQLWWQGHNGILGKHDSTEHFGAALAAGDFNGDGADGLAVGVPIENDHEGAVHVIYAAPVLDQTPPVVTPQISGKLGDNGWYTDNVLVNWTVVESDSLETLVKSGCSNTYIFDDTSGTTITCTATSEGGTTEMSVVVKRDSTMPNVTASFKTLDGEPYIGHYWTNQNVNATFTCEDAMSGVKVCPDPIVLDKEGDNWFSITSEDNAGNSTTHNNLPLTFSGTLIDKTVPVTSATVTGSVYADGNDPDYYNSSEPVIITLSANEDVLSDIYGTYYRVNQGEWRWYYTPLIFTDGGEYEIGFRSQDRAGNVEIEKSETFKIWYDQINPTITGTINPAPNDYGWNKGDVTISFACDDNELGVICPDDVVITDEVKNFPVVGIAEDAQGNKTKTTVFVNIDKIAPTTKHFIYGINYQNDWYWLGYSFEEGYKKGEPVRLYFGGKDYYATNINPPVSSVDYVEYSINDGEWQVYTGIFPVSDGEYSVRYRSVDRAGNLEDFNTFEFKTDLTPPTLTSVISPTPNEYGWNNESVNVSFFCEDSLSGVGEIIHNPPTINEEGEGHIENMGCNDRATNVSEITTTVNIDLTAPVISASATTEDGKPYVSGDIANQPVIVKFQCFDALSGIDVCNESQVLGEGLNQSVIGTAMDKAGNTSTINFDDINVDFTPPEAAVHVSASSLSVVEGGESDSYTIVLGKRPLADVTVRLEFYSEDIEMNPVSAQLIFTPYDWDEPQNMAVTAVNDSLVEEEESVTISHILTSQDVDYNGFGIDDLIVKITDNDIEIVPDDDENDNGDLGNNPKETDSSPRSQPIILGKQTNITSTDGLLSITLPEESVAGGGKITVQRVVIDSTIKNPGTGRIRIGDQAYDIQIVNSDGNTVQQLKGKIELTFKYNPEDLSEDILEEDLKVFYWDEELNVWLMVPTEQDPEKNTVIATVDHLTIFTILAAPDLNIAEDIRGHWAEADILKLYSLDMIKGYKDSTFRPDRELTRAEFVVLLAKSIGLNPVENPKLNFSDTVPDWVSGYVAAAVKAGWINGFTDGTFRANTWITREQIAVMSIRAISGSTSEYILNYTDKTDIQQWARSAVAKATQLGVMIGYEDGSFHPNAETTRAEASVIILRLLRQIVK